MNAMPPEFWPRVTDLMHRALDLPATERRAWIERETAGSAEIMAEVLRLLKAHTDAGQFLEEPLIAQAGAAAALHEALSSGNGGGVGVGSVIGDYRILRELGRGGMGTVYLGARADAVFEKQVAIKVAPGAIASDALRERFRRERQLLAALDHPCIARVVDGGSTVNGLQYLVMEYVDGTPIDAYCDAQHLAVATRLQLFVEVCRAVQYAHDRLIVHRDIKPSNVLVGADGRPKLLDFGIAKLLARDEGGGDPGATLVQAWTPESASPEQVRGETTSVATDVYGLGALLYQLLTGRPVFDLHGRDTVDRMRVVCEVVPAPPSVAIAQAHSGLKVKTVSADLDVITLKALHKDPARRYRSAEHLAEDVERYLAHRPVLAAPDSWRYRARKFVSRHPAATVATTVALLALLAVTVTALWQMRRADQERDRAQARLTDVRQLANTLIFDLYDRLENTPNATPMRRSLVEQGLAYLDRIAVDGGADPQLSIELADAYARLAQVQGAIGQSNLGDREGAESSLEKGRALLAPLRSRQDVPVEVELSDLRLLRRLASLVARDPGRAQRLAAEGIERTHTLRDKYPERTDVIDAQANAYFFAAMVSTPSDDLRLWTEANRVFRELADRARDNPSYLRSVALTEKYIGGVHHRANRLDMARANYERALELDRQVQKLRPDDRQNRIDLAIDLSNVGSVFKDAVPPDLTKAAVLYRESLGLREQAAEQDPSDVFARQALGFCLMQLCDLSRQLGDLDAAIRYGHRAVEAYESLPASEELVRRGYAWLNLGRAAREAGRHTDGCAALRRAQEYFTSASTAPRYEQQMLRANAMPVVTEALQTCEPSR